MMREAQEHADEDRQRREDAETRNHRRGSAVADREVPGRERRQAAAVGQGRGRRGAVRPARCAGRLGRRADQVGPRGAVPGRAEGGHNLYIQYGAASVGGSRTSGGTGAGAVTAGNEDVVDAEVVDEDDKK